MLSTRRNVVLLLKVASQNLYKTLQIQVRLCDIFAVYSSRAVEVADDDDHYDVQFR